MRDRGKRRKPPAEKQAQDNPAPLQPKFPDPPSDEGDARARSRNLKRSPTRLNFRNRQPAAEAGAGKSRSSKCGAIATAVAAAAAAADRQPARRAQPPALPRPGGPTGEAAEAEAPREAAEPAAQPAPAAKKPKGAVVLSIGLAGFGQEHLVQAA